ncbi:hypothetical protein NDU88_002662 [Pleurodeles waltl]|uniref:Uncharacterized protein n=1 Tax=Pleurodeles waltl TaxID=8319 RepID=A0AAV7W3Q3_PLEWA|nr:hypothetical protein NDU88_002662 [Pleurodeles waltl]
MCSAFVGEQAEPASLPIPSRGPCNRPDVGRRRSVRRRAPQASPTQHQHNSASVPCLINERDYLQELGVGTWWHGQVSRNSCRAASHKGLRHAFCHS